MNALKDQIEFVSPADYLAQELHATTRSEYLGGVVHAMSGAKIRHNRICASLLRGLGNRLEGRRCEPFGSDMKVRIQLPTHVRFYYPDAMVVCQSNPDEDAFQDAPVVIIEVLSANTRRVDTGEKREGYLTIPSLFVYLLVEQSKPAVICYRRGDHGFVQEIYQGLDAVISIPEVKLELPLAQIYERVEFGPDPEDVEED